MADLKTDADHYSSKARRLLNMNEHDRAIISWHLSLKGDSDNVDYLCIAIGYCMKGDFRKAAKNYAISLAINSDYSPAWNGSGSCLFHLGKYNEAILKFKKSVELDPKYTLGYLNWGLSLYCMKEEAEAERVIEEGLRNTSMVKEAIERYQLMLSLTEKRLSQATNEEEKALLKEQISACQWMLEVVSKKMEELEEEAKKTRLGRRGFILRWGD